MNQVDLTNLSRASMSKYLNMLLDCTLDKKEKEILFGLFVELEQQVKVLRDRVNYMEQASNKVDAYGKKL